MSISFFPISFQHLREDSYQGLFSGHQSTRRTGMPGTGELWWEWGGFLSALLQVQHWKMQWFGSQSELWWVKSKVSSFSFHGLYWEILSNNEVEDKNKLPLYQKNMVRSQSWHEKALIAHENIVIRYFLSIQVKQAEGSPFTTINISGLKNWLSKTL